MTPRSREGGSLYAESSSTRWDNALDRDQLNAALAGRPTTAPRGESEAKHKIEQELEALDALPQD